ncbi:MAG: glutamate 5-kinase [Hyphomicrobiales bacterium]|nr:glutamate 5-kinase [Hyphomicrobiales bacterium]
MATGPRSMNKKLSSHKRIVIKLGSSLLVDNDSGLKNNWLQSLLEDIVGLKRAGCDILVVSSGAIALGRTVLKLPSGILKLEEYQAAAATGQIVLASTFSSGLEKYDIHSGQILLTYGDTEERRRYLNARATIETLLEFGAIPIINENDTVATSEIRYGDNDRLAARVATMMSADMLVLLSDIDGLYTAPPSQNPEAKLVSDVTRITPEIEAMAGDAGTELSRGGMITKISAARIASENGTAMIITSGKHLNPLKALDEGVPHTLFHAAETPRSARKKWIAGQLQTRGVIVIDEGAIGALKNGKSLLPAGVNSFDGNFLRGDMVSIIDNKGKVLGQGIIAFDSANAKKIIGKRSADIAEILGYAGRSEMIHRDDMILIEPNSTENSDA